MLSVAEEYLCEHNREAKPLLYGQDWNDEAWAVCRSDMLIKGENAENIILGDSFSRDGYPRGGNSGRPSTFDYMLANPPFGVEWKQQQRHIVRERDTLGFGGRFGAGLPRINDGSLLFLQHMLSKMQTLNEKGSDGSRIAIVFNGSPLFIGDAGSGREQHPPVDHRARLAGGNRGFARSALLQHRHLNLCLGADETARSPGGGARCSSSTGAASS